MLKQIDPKYLVVVSGVGRAESSHNNGRNFSISIDTRSGGLIVRTMKEIIFALSCLSIIFWQRPKLVILSLPNYVSSSIIALALRFLNISYVLDVRDLYPESIAYGGLVNKNSFFYKFLDKSAKSLHLGAVHMIAATEGLRKHLKRKYNTLNIDVVLNGFPASEINNIKGEGGQKVRDVVFHGTLGRMQDAEFLADLVSCMPDVSFSFIGSGASMKKLDPAALSNLNVFDRMSHADVLRVVSKHKVGLSIRSGSVYDRLSLPVKIFEYLGLGLSVVSYPKTEFSTMDFGYALQECDEKSMQSISAAIYRAITSADEREKSKESGDENQLLALSREVQSEKFGKIVLTALDMGNI